MEKYINAINMELKAGNRSLARRIKTMGKGTPIEDWSIDQLKKLCQLCHISLMTKEEQVELKEKEEKRLNNLGINTRPVQSILCSDRYDDGITTIVNF